MTPTVTLLRSSANETQGQVSPDGKWLAYSDEAGQNQVYLLRFESGGQLSAAKWQVSSGARAFEPRWRADSKELFYLESSGPGMGTVTAVSIGSAPDPIGTTMALVDVRTSIGTPYRTASSIHPLLTGSSSSSTCSRRDCSPRSRSSSTGLQSRTLASGERIARRRSRSWRRRHADVG